MLAFEMEFSEFLDKTIEIYELVEQLDQFGTPIRPVKKTIATKKCRLRLNNGSLNIDNKMDSKITGRVYCGPLVVGEGKFANIDNKQYVITLCNNYPNDHCELDIRYESEI